MPIALSRLWTAFFVAVLLVPVAGVVSGLIGTQTGLTFWIMGIAAHQPVLSVTNLSSRRRLAIWLTAMTVGGITAGLGAVAISLVMQTTAYYAQTASGQVTNVFWFVVAIRLAIRWAPVMVAWVVSGILVRRSSRRGQVASSSAATRRGTQDLHTQMAVTGESVQNDSEAQTDVASNGGLRIAFRVFAKTVVSIGLLFLLLLANDFLSDQAHLVGVATGWAILILCYAPTLVYVWGPASLGTSVTNEIRRWLRREWRLVPFYAAAILVSIAALRYILGK